MFPQFRNMIGNSLLMSPPESSAGVADKSVGTSNELTKSDIIDFLGEDDDKEVIPLKDDKKDDDKDKKDDKKETKTDKEESEEDKETDKEDEDEELKAIEEELEEPSEEKLELTTPTSRREILKKYPQLFKDFPYLETAYYREQEFTKILPTIKDAKEAVEKSQTLDNLESDLAGGNTETILRAIKENNPKSFYKIVDGYLDVLGKIDKDAYLHVIGNTIKHTIRAMVDEARSSQNEALQEAAAILNQFAFGSSKFTPPTKLSTDEKSDVDSEKEKQITEREQRFVRQKYETANGELSTKINKTFKSTIDANIDPKETMTPYVRRTASRDALEELESLISKDTRFGTIVDKLWERAFKNDFSPESVAKIRSAFVSKAQTLLPSIIKKHRNEALRGMGNRKADKDDDSRPDNESNNGDESRRRNDSKKGDESHRRSSKGDSKSVPDGMSSLEFLMSDD